MPLPKQVQVKATTVPALAHTHEDCELVAKGLEAVADAAQRVIAGPLTMRALCLLIREQLPRGTKQKISAGDVQDVLEAAAGLRGYVVRKAVR